jgi:hypothetical protein
VSSREDEVRIETHLEREIAVGNIRIRGIERPVSIRIDKDATLTKGGCLRTRVHCETSNERTASLSISSGSEQTACRQQDTLILAVQSIVGGIDQRIAECERKAVVGQEVPGCLGMERQNDVPRAGTAGPAGAATGTK